MKIDTVAKSLPLCVFSVEELNISKEKNILCVR